jgi:hypothetical protein
MVYAGYSRWLGIEPPLANLIAAHFAGPVCAVFDPLESRVHLFEAVASHIDYTILRILDLANDMSIRGGNLTIVQYRLAHFLYRSYLFSQLFSLLDQSLLILLKV